MSIFLKFLTVIGGIFVGIVVLLCMILAILAIGICIEDAVDRRREDKWVNGGYIENRVDEANASKNKS